MEAQRTDQLICQGADGPESGAQIAEHRSASVRMKEALDKEA